MGNFPNNPISKNEPHVFATSEESYQRMKKDKRPQSIVVSGESGAGKTETNKCAPRPRLRSHAPWRELVAPPRLLFGSHAPPPDATAGT